MLVWGALLLARQGLACGWAWKQSVETQGAWRRKRFVWDIAWPTTFLTPSFGCEKKLPDRSWTEFHPCMKSGSDRAVQQTRISFRSEKEKRSQSLHAISEPLTGDQKNESLSPFATTVYGFMAETLVLILSMFLEFDYFTTFRICIE